jgi:hypothetical protein
LGVGHPHAVASCQVTEASFRPFFVHSHGSFSAHFSRGN